MKCSEKHLIRIWRRVQLINSIRFKKGFDLFNNFEAIIKNLTNNDKKETLIIICTLLFKYFIILKLYPLIL